MRKTIYHAEYSEREITSDKIRDIQKEIVNVLAKNKLNYCEINLILSDFKDVIEEKTFLEPFA